MTAADKIAEAKALIEPLTGYAVGPWAQEHRHTGLGYATQVFPPQDEWNTIATLAWHSVPNDQGGERTTREANARLIAASPALRDTVAALADLADAQAQEIARLRIHLRRMLMSQDGVPLNAIQFGQWVDEARAALGDAP